MIIGVPKEIKNNEFRVAITAAGVARIPHATATRSWWSGARAWAPASRTRNTTSPAPRSSPNADDVWSRADMVMKVKEPIKAEYDRFRKGLILFTYLHLAAEPELTQELINSGVTAIAYETVQEGRALPLLAPMSEVAGRLSVRWAPPP